MLTFLITLVQSDENISINIEVIRSNLQLALQNLKFVQPTTVTLQRYGL